MTPAVRIRVPRPSLGGPVAMRLGIPITRSSDAGLFLETFLVAAVAAAILVRSYLALTGYPKVGNGELHIAHMLWGGLLMLVGIVVLLLFLDRPLQHAAAFVAGIGFGIFLDEIGKFVTRDNDYFFRPAIALIYVVFVALFLVLRAVLSAPMLNPREAQANVLELLEGALDGALDPRARAQIAGLLRASPNEPLTIALRAYASTLEDQRPVVPWVASTAGTLDRAYRRAVGNRFFEVAAVALVAVYSIGSLVAVGLLITSEGGISADAATVQALATFAGSLLVLRGIPDLWRNRVDAYRWFQRGILVWILVAQPFVFYGSQLAGLVGLTFDLVAYAVVRYLISREHVIHETD
jgi:hypothetical protein